MRKMQTRVLYFGVFILILIVLLFLFSMLSQNEGYGTVSGTITYGPTYPGPCRVGMDCTDKPYNGTGYIKLEDGSTIVQGFNADSEGKFSISIKQGSYFLEVGQRFIGVCGKNFVVEKDKTTNLSISCDTGMR